MRLSPKRVSVLCVLCCVGLLLSPIAEAKKRRAISASSFKILQVTPSPVPFEIGNGELTLSTLVKVPKNLKGMDVLEVTVLITSVTQRSMRFLSQRVPLKSKRSGRTGARIPVEFVWNGKDHAQTLVEPGVFRYEVRAKLMAEKRAGILTRMVSRRLRGTVEVIASTVPEPPPVVEELPQTLDSDPQPSGDIEEAIPQEAGRICNG